MTGFPVHSHSKSEVMSAPISSPPNSSGSIVRSPVAVAPTSVFGVNVNGWVVPAEFQDRAWRPVAVAGSWSTFPVNEDGYVVEPAATSPHSLVVESAWSLDTVILALLTRQEASMG